MDKVNVLCVKWGDKYGPDYVNRLHNMVCRHLKRPFRFVCLTDDESGLDPTIEAFDLPETGFQGFDRREPWTKLHGWLKLTSFVNPLYDLTGTTLFIDLDVVIVDNIDSFFEPEGEFLVIREWDKSDGTGNTSVYRYEIGAHADAIEYLAKNKQGVMQRVRNEQEFITQHVASQKRLSYWPDGWCVSFKRHCVRRPPMSFFKPPKLPEGTKIVAFHGKPNPPDAIAGRSGKWYRKILPTPWVEEHWR